MNNWFWVIWTWGTQPHHQTFFFLPCHSWGTASDWGRPLPWRINFCQINNWFWAIWTSWGKHPHHQKIFYRAIFGIQLLNGSVPATPGDEILSNELLILGNLKVLRAIRLFQVFFLDVDKSGDNIISRLKLEDSQSDLAHYSKSVPATMMKISKINVQTFPL
jgi:hypothetical protein